MAKYSKVWENGIETSTLNFRGQVFTLTMGVWKENGPCISKEKNLVIQMEEAYPDDENLEDIVEAVESLDDDFYREVALVILGNLECTDK
ncbi:MAG: hypothetical protein APF81_08400 [Desulfosporosinus sp. BRH_c37]|nr:MAG: hypothetical protein APF81_08400 [Desulfosporosinus sp. BRH_c37]